MGLNLGAARANKCAVDADPDSRVRLYLQLNKRSVHTQTDAEHLGQRDLELRCEL